MSIPLSSKVDKVLLYNTPIEEAAKPWISASIELVRNIPVNELLPHLGIPLAVVGLVIYSGYKWWYIPPPIPPLPDADPLFRNHMDVNVTNPAGSGALNAPRVGVPDIVPDFIGPLLPLVRQPHIPVPVPPPGYRTLIQELDLLDAAVLNYPEPLKSIVAITAGFILLCAHVGYVGYRLVRP